MKTYRCPECGSDDVRVLVFVRVIPTEEGISVTDDIIKRPANEADCEACGWNGTLSNLTLKEL